MIADVHANAVALEAVLSAMPAVDEIWAMGDHVGYGPEPAGVLALLRDGLMRLVAGNHDRAVGTGRGADDFPNRDAAEVARQHAAWLSTDDREMLALLPLVARQEDATLFHGSLADPLNEYVFDREAAAVTLRAASTSLCCNGHTHIPAIFALDQGGARSIRPEPDVPYPLTSRVLVNPGSVGQPRDGDPRAAWALFEPGSRRVTFHRTVYDVARTQRQMRERGLPARLIDRLALGI